MPRRNPVARTLTNRNFRQRRIEDRRQKIADTRVRQAEYELSMLLPRGNGGLAILDQDVDEFLDRWGY